MRKRRELYLDVKEVPQKINEIISYLSMEFSRNCLLERDDLAQDLYLLYFTITKRRPKLKKEMPGYFFIKFKWFLLTKWRKKVNSINKEWAYKLQQLGEYNHKKSTRESDEKKSPYKKKYRKYKF